MPSQIMMAESTTRCPYHGTVTGLPNPAAPHGEEEAKAICPKCWNSGDITRVQFEITDPLDAIQNAWAVVDSVFRSRALDRAQFEDACRALGEARDRLHDALDRWPA